MDVSGFLRIADIIDESQSLFIDALVVEIAATYHQISVVGRNTPAEISVTIISTICSVVG